MKYLILYILLTGCAGTQFSENGKKVFYTQANVSHLELHTPAGSSLIMDGVNHSTPTRAGGSVLGTGLTGATSITTAILAGGL